MYIEQTQNRIHIYIYTSIYNIYIHVYIDIENTYIHIYNIGEMIRATPTHHLALVTSLFLMFFGASYWTASKVFGGYVHGARPKARHYANVCHTHSRTERVYLTQATIFFVQHNSLPFHLSPPSQPSLFLLRSPPIPLPFLPAVCRSPTSPPARLHACNTAKGSLHVCIFARPIDHLY